MKLREFLIPFFFGLIGVLAFEPFSIKPLIILSYAYIIRELIGNDTYKIFKLIIWSFGHWGFGMSWLIVSVYYYGETSILISFIIFILLVLILTVVFALPLLLIKYRLFHGIKSEKIINLFLITSILVLCELSRDYLLNGVPWLIPGIVFLDTYMQNIYSIVGIAGGSSIIYIIATSIAIFWNRRITIFLVSLILFIPVFYSDKELSGDIKVSIVQPSSDPFLKYKNGYKSIIEDNLITLLKNTAKESKLIVLPEAELPYTINSEDFIEFKSKLDLDNAYFLFGVWNYSNNKLYNSFLNLNSGQIYNKQHLVPFGEYIPFISSLRGLIDFFDMPMSNVSKGTKNQDNFAIELDKSLKIAPLICFDIAFASTVRKSNISSDLMINISNDTWFGDSIGPYYHLAITRVRAIENNRWIIRSTNDGISAIISNKGTIVDKLEKGKSGVINSGVNIVQERTIYNSYGYYLPYFLSILFLISSVIISVCIKQRS